MRSNPALDIEEAITGLAVGEALVSLLDEKGRPGITERLYVVPPGSRLGPITPTERQALVAGSLVAGVYEQAVDRESAHETLKARAAAAPVAPAGRTAQDAARPDENAPAGGAGGVGGWLGNAAGGLLRGSGRKDSVLETVAKSAARTIGSTVGREIIRGVLGGIFGGAGRRR
jgi:DNA helicase HerA-like ATPase